MQLYLDKDMDLTDQLNASQKEAVNFVEGACLVIAGAGSGKTRVVTYRIAHLLEMGVPSSSILGLTFTNKAAGEMKSRVLQLTNSHVLICTFHSLGSRILRESIHHLGYKQDFLIYDEQDSDKLLKDCLNDLGLEEKKIDLKGIKALISSAKNNLEDPGDIDSTSLPAKVAQVFVQICDRYQARLKEYNAVDFDDLLYLTVKLFREHPEVLEQYQDRWSFLLIDEYQDTNASQYALVDMLIRKSRNLFAVGDPDQSIYSWRGANISNILNFEKDHSGAKIIRLEQNYRSRSNILSAANALISHNQRRFEKNLWSDRGAGEPIMLFKASSERDEAEFVAERIRSHHEQHEIPLNEMVVFYRTNAQSRALEDVFLSKRIPYVIVGGISFYQRKEIKDILAFLRIVHSGMDFISFSRTINIPKRGIGQTTIEKIRAGASQEDKSILSFCDAIVKGESLKHPLKLAAKQQSALREYVQLIHELKEIAAAGSISKLVKGAIERSCYLKFLEQDEETYDDRKENLAELIAKAIEWETSTENPTLSSFLEELSLKSNLDEADITQDRVNLMTLHNGKGLEFMVAFLVGMEEDLCPHINSRESPEALEEERRLCYVGMTRAKEFLYITYSSFRYIWGTSRTHYPSRFISEIPYEYLKKLSHYKAGQRERFQPTHVEDQFIDDIDQTLQEEFVEGDAVFHQEFGIGIIQAVSNGSVGLTYKILFSKDNRERSIVAKYARLRKL